MVAGGEQRAAESEEGRARERAEGADALRAQEHERAEREQSLVEDQERRSGVIGREEREAGDLGRIQRGRLERGEEGRAGELEPVPQREASGEQLLVAVDVARQEIALEVDRVRAAAVARGLVRARDEDGPLRGDEQRERERRAARA